MPDPLPPAWLRSVLRSLVEDAFARRGPFAAIPRSPYEAWLDQQDAAGRLSAATVRADILAYLRGREPEQSLEDWLQVCDRAGRARQTYREIFLIPFDPAALLAGSPPDAPESPFRRRHAERIVADLRAAGDLSDDYVVRFEHALSLDARQQVGEVRLDRDIYTNYEVGPFLRSKVLLDLPDGSFDVLHPEYVFLDFDPSRARSARDLQDRLVRDLRALDLLAAAVAHRLPAPPVAPPAPAR